MSSLFHGIAETHKHAHKHDWSLCQRHFTFEVSRREATPRIWFALIGWSNQFSRKSGTAVGTPNSRCHVLYKLLLMVCELWGHQQLYLIFQRPCHQLLGLATTFAERHEKKSWALIQGFWRKGWGLELRCHIHANFRYDIFPGPPISWFRVVANRCCGLHVMVIEVSIV